jgi:LmbE family N-acetylglucosaminyl deacetylase
LPYANLFVDITTEMDVKLKMLRCTRASGNGSKKHRAWTISLTTCDAPVLNYQAKLREKA